MLFGTRTISVAYADTCAIGRFFLSVHAVMRGIHTVHAGTRAPRSHVIKSVPLLRTSRICFLFPCLASINLLSCCDKIEFCSSDKRFLKMPCNWFIAVEISFGFFFETAFSFSFLQVQRPLSLRMNWHELAKASTHFLMSLLRK
jgi:hypothetical protein